MPDVHDFVIRRHKVTETDPRRQALGNQHRVPVPPTKLHDIRLGPSHATLAPNISVGSPLAGLGPQETIAGNNHALGDHVDSFDTDGESFDDTTIMTISNNFQHQSHHTEDCRQSFDHEKLGAVDRAPHRPDALFPTEVGQHPDQLLPDQLGFEDSGVDEDDRSSEYSGGDGSEAKRFLDGNIKKELHNPEFFEFRKHMPLENRVLLQSTKRTAPSTAYNSLALRLPTEAFRSQEAHSPISSKRPTDAVCIGKINTQIHLRDRPFTSKGSKQTQEFSYNESQEVTPNQGTRLQQASQQFRASGAVGEAAKQHNGSSLGHAHGSLIKDGTTSKEHKNERPQALSDRIPLSVGSIGHVDDFSDFDPRESDANGIAMTLKGLQTRKRKLDLDHSIGDLSDMTFQQLSSEAFELKPQGGASNKVAAGLTESPLSDDLDRIFHLKDEEDKVFQRTMFFNSLSIEQYEECGDLMLERISALIAKFKDTRKQKRNVARCFEEEVARRDERVRGKEVALEKDLSRLKRAGEAVVNGNSAEGQGSDEKTTSKA